MKRLITPLGAALALLLSATPALHAQNALPSAQPKRLVIIREVVKTGQAANHARHEAGWPAALAKANVPEGYIALTSITGRAEAWYLSPWDSFAAEAAAMKRDDKNPVLGAELARLAERDAEFIESSTTIHLRARADLSAGKFPVMAKVRFYEITLFNVRVGKEKIFEDVAKAYGTALLRVAPDASFRVYAVDAGMPEPTFVVMSSLEDYSGFDTMSANGAKVWGALTPEEKATFDKWGDAVMRSESQRFRVDPSQSYVSKEVRATDPGFWGEK